MSLAVGLVIGMITEHYTGTEGSPVHTIAKSAITGPATVIISGVAVGLIYCVANVMICVAIGLANVSLVCMVLQWLRWVCFPRRLQ